MIIWIDGTYGVGKTAVAKKIMENFSDDNIELLESDYYSSKLLKRIVEEAKANNSFPYIGGILPQNNMLFLKEFGELIEEKSKNAEKNLIVDMALTMKESKEKLFDRLKSADKNILHIILTADEDTIKSRIENDVNRMKGIAKECLIHNITFLDKNFPDAMRIKTDNRDVDDIATEIIGVI